MPTSQTGSHSRIHVGSRVDPEGLPFSLHDVPYHRSRPHDGGAWVLYGAAKWWGRPLGWAPLTAIGRLIWPLNPVTPQLFGDGGSRHTKRSATGKPSNPVTARLLCDGIIRHSSRESRCIKTRRLWKAEGGLTSSAFNQTHRYSTSSKSKRDRMHSLHAYRSRRACTDSSILTVTALWTDRFDRHLAA